MSLRQHIFSVEYGTLSFKMFISSASQSMKKIYLGQLHPSKKRFEILYQIAPLAQGLSKVAKILTIVPYATNSLFTNNSKFTYTQANVIISRPMVTYGLQMCQLLKNNLQNAIYGTNQAIFTRTMQEN